MRMFYMSAPLNNRIGMPITAEHVAVDARHQVSVITEAVR